MNYKHNQKFEGRNICISDWNLFLYFLLSIVLQYYNKFFKSFFTHLYKEEQKVKDFIFNTTCFMYWFIKKE